MIAVDRLLSIFFLFSSEKVEWSAEEAASHLGFSLSTTYRYFRSLSEVGLIVAFVAGRYVLGPAIIQFDTKTRVNDPLIRVGVPIMRRLAGETAAPAAFLLCRLYRRQAICIHQEAANFGAATDYERGRLMPLHRGAASKIILAHLTGPIAQAYLEQNKKSIEDVGLGRDWIRLKRNLRALRHANFCVTHGELDTDETMIAAPIFAPDGSVIGSLSLLVACDEDRYKLHPSTVDRIRHAAKQITVSLGQIAAGWDRLEEDRLRALKTHAEFTEMNGDQAAAELREKIVQTVSTAASSPVTSTEVTIDLTSSVRAPRRDYHYRANAQPKQAKTKTEAVKWWLKS